MAKQFTLGKKERLKSRKQIEQLFTDGKNFPLSPFRIYYRLADSASPSQSNLQFGVGVSAKNFKRAVDRNRIKRLTREGYRLQKNQLQEALRQRKLQLHLFFIYTSKEPPDFNTVKDKVNVILSKLLKVTNESSPPHT